MQDQDNTVEEVKEVEGDEVDGFEILPDDHIYGHLNEDGDLVIGYNPNTEDPYQSGRITIRNKSTAIKFISALKELVNEME